MIKKCIKMKLISAYHYKEINNYILIKKIEKHLSECEKCNKVYTSMKKLSYNIPKVDIGNKIENKITYIDLKNVKHESFHFKSIISIAALVLIVFSIYLIFAGNNQKEEDKLNFLASIMTDNFADEDLDPLEELFISDSVLAE